MRDMGLAFSMFDNAPKITDIFLIASNCVFLEVDLCMYIWYVCVCVLWDMYVCMCGIYVLYVVLRCYVCYVVFVVFEVAVIISCLIMLRKLLTFV